MTGKISTGIWVYMTEGKNTQIFPIIMFILIFFSAERRERYIHEVCEKVRVTKDDISHFKALMIHSFINQL